MNVPGSKISKVVALSLVSTLTLVTACSSGKDNGATGASASPQASASAAAGSAAPSAKKVKLKLVSYGLSADNRWERIYARWLEKHPNIEVEYKEFPNDVNEYWKALDIAVAGNENMDVLVATDNSNVVTRGQQGILMDVNTLAAKDNFDLVANFGSIMKDIQTQGKTYFIPYNVNFNALYYNKEMFDAKGIKYPDENTTYAELAEMAKKLTSGDGPNKVYGLVLNSPNSQLAYSTLENTGWNWVKADGTPNFLDPRVKSSLTTFKGLFDAGAMPTFITMGLEKINNRLLFAQKKAAMIINNWWTPVQWNMFRFNDKSMWQSGIDFTIGAVAAPRFDADSTPKMQNVTAGAGYAISAKTKYPEESYQFVKFLATECADIFGLISSYKKADPNQLSDIFNKFTDNDKKAHADIYPQTLVAAIKKVNDEVISATSTGNMPRVDAGVRKALVDLVNRDSTEYFTGKIGIDEFLKKLQTNAEDAVKKLK
ncbi:MAG: extracellular solute-binding protein [Paenibacillaceae bacterium]|nr:extracellular solute-binding protein [Paenibacillaceae bacterium]